MINSSKAKFILPPLVVLMIFSAISFCLPFEKNVVFYISYAVTALSILWGMWTLWAVFEEKPCGMSKFYKIPVLWVWCGHFVAQLLVGLLFVALSEIVSLSIAISIFALLLALSLLGTLTAAPILDPVPTLPLEVLHKRLMNLLPLCQTDKPMLLIIKLSEEIKISDPKLCDDTKELEDKLSSLIDRIEVALKKDDLDQMTALYKKALLVLEERNRRM